MSRRDRGLRDYRLCLTPWVYVTPDAKSMLAQVRWVLDQGEYRTLKLSSAYGWSQERIARRLGITQQAVSHRLGKIREKCDRLRRQVEQAKRDTRARYSAGPIAA